MQGYCSLNTNILSDTYFNYLKRVVEIFICIWQYISVKAVYRCIFENKRPNWCHLLFYFTSYVLNMFRTLIYPSSGVCDYSVELPHWLYCSWFGVCWSFGVVGLGWYPSCRLQPTPTQPHQISKTHRTKNNTSNVLIQQNSRKLLMMGILTFWRRNYFFNFSTPCI